MFIDTKLLAAQSSLRRSEMFSNTSQSIRSFLTGFPTPPTGFENITKDTPGKYVFSEKMFNPDRTIFKPTWDRQRINSKLGDDIVVGLTTILLVFVITEILLTFVKSTATDMLSFCNAQCANQRKACQDIAEDATFFRNFDMKSFYKRNEAGKWRWYRVCVGMLLGLILFLLDVAVIILVQSQKYRSGPFAYNLRGSHPVGTDLGLGMFLRRTVELRPCVTPVFYESNPFRNFSISTCHSLKLKEAHKEAEDRVSSVTIGSWFHSAGSDHRILFGNASIEIRARAYVYGIENGTRRLLFPDLKTNYVSVTLYLHHLLIYKILSETCQGRHSTKSCEEVFAEHHIESTMVTREIKWWLPKENKFKRFEEKPGLETTLRAEIHKPWSTVYQSVGPLMTTELIEEVEGAGLYSHISTERREEDIPGLLYQESKRVGLSRWTVTLAVCGVILIVLKLVRIKPSGSPIQSQDDLPSPPGSYSPPSHSPNLSAVHIHASAPRKGEVEVEVEVSPLSQCTTNSSESR